jgi:hypothetical protein
VALAAYREAVVDWGAKYVILETVSEEMLALMEEGAKLYSRYPHVLIYAGAAAEPTIKVMNEYDKYKFAFRAFHPDYDLTPWFLTLLWDAKNVLGVKKVALFIEDAAWTLCMREGTRVITKYGVIEEKPLRDYARELGLEVVYEAKIPVGERNFVPNLEIAYAKGAELIYVLSSTYTDCVTLVKQWSTSIARDVYIALSAGPNMWTIFWDLTGGAALGVISLVYDVEDYPPVSPYTQGFIKKMHEKGLRVDVFAHHYYSIIYHIKEAMEYVARQGKDPNNVEEVIKALEAVPCSVHTLLPKEWAILGSKEKGRFHSYPTCPGLFFQFQGPDKVVLISSPDNPYLKGYYSVDLLKRYCHPELVKKPAELRRS